MIQKPPPIPPAQQNAKIPRRTFIKLAISAGSAIVGGLGYALVKVPYGKNTFTDFTPQKTLAIQTPASLSAEA